MQHYRVCVYTYTICLDARSMADMAGPLLSTRSSVGLGPRRLHVPGGGKIPSGGEP